ncbi:MAG: hypothetical protein JWO94_3012, partial [Verrucomicrobiaceae bacterium]|nr:hypothetical protein [Verrucomicrobiaceae bacterium]
MLSAHALIVAMMCRLLFSLLILASLPCQAAEVDLTGYVPLNRAVTAKIDPPKVSLDGLTGYLGVSLKDDSAGILTVDQISAGSPAMEAGIQPGDVLTSVEAQALHSAAEARTLLQTFPPGTSVRLELKRGTRHVTVKAVLTATSRPLKPSTRVIMGVKMGEPSEEGIPVLSVTKDMPAARAGVRLGDIILSVDGADVGEARLLADVLSEKKAGDEVTLRLRRRQEEMTRKVTLATSVDNDLLPDEERRELKIWKKPAYRIAIVPIEFSDLQHSPKITLQDWQEAFFSRGTYNKTNALGQTVYGSMNDYYQEASCGKMSITGKVFPWVMAEKTFTAYSQLRMRGGAKGGLLMEVMDALLKREGAHALDEFDGIGFIYAGETGKDITRGSIFWPHRSGFRRNGKLWSYVII